MGKFKNIYDKYYADIDFNTYVTERKTKTYQHYSMYCYESDVKIEKLNEALGFPASQHDELMSSLTGGDKFKHLIGTSTFLKTRCTTPR